MHNVYIPGSSTARDRVKNSLEKVPLTGGLEGDSWKGEKPDFAGNIFHKRVLLQLHIIL